MSADHHEKAESGASYRKVISGVTNKSHDIDQGASLLQLCFRKHAKFALL